MEPVAPNSAQANQYDFITQATKGKLPGAGMPKKAKLILFGGGAFLLFLVLFLVYNLFFKTPENAQILSRVGRQQAHILQAAETGVEKARGQAARNLAVTVQLSLTGDQEPLLDGLKSQNIRISTKDDEELTQMLVTAEQANRFDEELTHYLTTELGSYVKNLDAAYRSTQDKGLKEILAAQYKNAKFLAGESAEES